jgi:hypothetical protein
MTDSGYFLALKEYILKPKWFSDFVIRTVKCSLNPPLAPAQEEIWAFFFEFDLKSQRQVPSLEGI